MFERHHGGHEQFKSYWVTLSDWPSIKSVDLNEALAMCTQTLNSQFPSWTAATAAAS